MRLDAGAIDNADGTIVALGGDVRVRTGSLDNQQGLVASQDGALEVRSTGAVRNQGGTLQASLGSIDITAAQGLDNSVGGLVNAQCGTNCTQADFDRIDQQVGSFAVAANLAELAKRETLTIGQAQQLAQVFLEVAPGSGTAESVMQLITGKSSLTGEEANRFWAAVGVVPVAGGVFRKVGEPAAEALGKYIKQAYAQAPSGAGGGTVKPPAINSGQAASSLQGNALQRELTRLSQLGPDTSRDAYYLANTDPSIAANNNLAMDHVLGGEISPRGNATGYHAELAADGSARIAPGATVKQNANGTYEAPVQIFDEGKGQWVDKRYDSTFFPLDWSEARINYEVTEAFKKGSPHARFESTSPSGIKIQFNWDPKNQRTTFYPIGNP